VVVRTIRVQVLAHEGARLPVGCDRGGVRPRQEIPGQATARRERHGNTDEPHRPDRA